jgi:undecaprenyl-diphosphatase
MDDRLFFLINRVWTNAFADQVWATLTSAAVWLPFLTVGLGVGLWLGTFRVRSFLLVAAVALLAVAGPFNSVAKRWAHRPRPAETEPGVREVSLQKARPAFLGIFLPVRVGYSGNTHEPARGRSFPSGHVVNNALVATLALAYFRAWGLLAAPVALLVTYSRVYCGSHWPSDALASLPLGVILALLTLGGLEAVYRRVGRRWWPALFGRHPSLFRGR